MRRVHLASNGKNEVSPYLQALTLTWIEVPDLGFAKNFFVEILGYVIRSQGEGAVEFEYLGISPSTKWIIVGAPDATTGEVLLFEGKARKVESGFPRGWDSIEAVSGDIDQIYAEVSKYPEIKVAFEPFDADFSDLSSNVHRSACWLLPWGNHVMLTQAVTQPEGREFPKSSVKAGRVFEMHLRTDQYEAGRHLFIDLLEMPQLMDISVTSGPFHVGWKLEPDHLINMVFLKSGGLGTGGGAIELQGHPVAKLHPQTPSGRGQTPGGTAMVTLTSKSIETARARIVADGKWDCTDILLAESGPHKGRRTFIFWAVENAAIELVEEI